MQPEKMLRSQGNEDHKFTFLFSCKDLQLSYHNVTTPLTNAVNVPAFDTLIIYSGLVHRNEYYTVTITELHGDQ